MSERELILAALAELKDDLRSGMDGLNNRLDTLNSRTRKVEVSTAIQWVLWLIAGAVLSALAPSVIEAAFK